MQAILIGVSFLLLVLFATYLCVRSRKQTAAILCSLLGGLILAAFCYLMSYPTALFRYVDNKTAYCRLIGQLSHGSFWENRISELLTGKPQSMLSYLGEPDNVDHRDKVWIWVQNGQSAPLTELLSPGKPGVHIAFDKHGISECHDCTYGTAMRNTQNSCMADSE